MELRFPESMQAPTYSEWAQYFPEGTFPNFMEMQYDLFKTKIDFYVPYERGYPNFDFYRHLFIYCMAHFAWEYEAQVKGDHTSDAGPVVMAKVDKVTAHYQRTGVTNEYESFFGQSRFGREFLNLIYLLRKNDLPSIVTIATV